ncbi:MAG: RNA-binding S4 domain-containing protein [Lachnospiraceae bacterium]|nr:RNA-binding S4 domain-containing protein [Lachnospiraceae bacterium]
MYTVAIRDEFIKLGQALKLAGAAESGADAKDVIKDGQVSVNGVVEYRRGRKLVPGDVFIYDGKEYRIESR